MTITIKTVNTDNAVNALAKTLAAQVDGELAQMFASHTIAAKLPDAAARNAVVDAAVDTLNLDPIDPMETQRAKNLKARGRAFFGASRHFGMTPPVGFVFMPEGSNKPQISLPVLKAALDKARSEAVTKVDHAKASDLKSSSGERYAWATALNKAEGTEAETLLTANGIAQFFADRLTPHVAARLAAEKAEADKLAKAAADKAAADALTVDRTPAPQAQAPAPQAQAPAPQAPAIKAEAAPQAQAPSPQAQAPAGKSPVMPQVAPAPGRPSHQPDGRIDAAPVAPDLVAAYRAIKAPAARDREFKALVLAMMEDGVTPNAIREIVAEAQRAHDRKHKAEADKVQVAERPSRKVAKADKAEAAAAISDAVIGDVLGILNNA
jgi:hypothetical protein